MAEIVQHYSAFNFFDVTNCNKNLLQWNFDATNLYNKQSPWYNQIC